MSSRQNFVRNLGGILLAVLSNFFDNVRENPGVTIASILKLLGPAPGNNEVSFMFEISTNSDYAVVKYNAERHIRGPRAAGELFFSPANWRLLRTELRDIFSTPGRNSSRSLTFKIPMTYIREHSLDSAYLLQKFSILFQPIADVFQYNNVRSGHVFYMSGSRFFYDGHGVASSFLNIRTDGEIFEDRYEYEHDEEEYEAPVPRGASRITTATRHVTAEENGAQCAICQTDFKSGETVQPLSCNHVFHPDCIRQWYNTSATCPMCRQLSTGGRRRKSSKVRKTRSRSTRH